MNIKQHVRKVDGYNILYLAGGNPRNDVMLFLHGIGASSDRWVKVMPLFSHDFYTLAPDIIGFGYSDKPEANYTMQFFTDFVLKFIESMDLLDRRIIIVGSSLGGHIACEFAIRYPTLLSDLILSNSAGVLRHSTQGLNDYVLAAMYPTLEHAMRAFSNMMHTSSIDPDYTRDFVNRMMLPNAKYAFLASLMGSKRSTLIGRLHLIETRTLVIWGEHDKLIPVENANEFKAIPDVEIVIMRSVGHLPFVEKPKEFYTIVKSFLDRDR